MLSQARAFFPKQAPIDQLQARVDKLPEVSGLLRQALNLELAERYAEALEIYKTVADLDPATRLLTERGSSSGRSQNSAYANCWVRSER